ncbi:MAG: acyl-CoA synthetase [Rhodospirillaceae bacterium]|nr:acyl-CoA synthetase [Rhodospirillaceae bacterium]
MIDLEASAKSLEPLFNPQSVAVLGASRDASRIGGMPVRYMLKHEFAGDIYPVNPSHDEVQGLKAYAAIGEIGKPVDTAIMAVPARFAIEVAEQCADAGVKSICAFTSGFAEMGEEGAEMQARLKEIAAGSGMRIMGPNCLGYFNARARYYATFSTSVTHGEPKLGNVGMVSQSGAFGSHCFVLGRERGLGFTYLITTGNEVDVDVADCIAYFAYDDDTEVIAAYMEGCQDGEKLRAALRLAYERGKPVVIQKVGRSEVGAQAAFSHTASLAGVDKVYDAVFAEYNVYRARTAAELIDVAYLLSFGIWPTGNKIAVATISGGAGVLMADASADAGLDMAPMPEDTQTRLKELIPFAGPRNPVDFTAQVYNEFHTVTDYVRAIFEEGGYDSVIAFFSSLLYSEPLTKKIIDALLPVRKDFPDRLFLLCAMGPQENRTLAEEEGIPVLEDPTYATDAIAAVTAIGSGFARGLGKTPELTKTPPLPDGPINESLAKSILAEIGIPSPKEILIESRDAAIDAAKKIGKPVALKIVSADIQHKSDIGGVRLGIHGDDAVGGAFDEITTAVDQAAPDAAIDGILVSEMVAGGVETILGVQNDPLFGPVVMFGLGGVFAEVMEDVVFRLAPFDEDTALAMIRGIGGFPLLDGARGTAQADMGALAGALSKLSVFAAKHEKRLETIDINPLRVLPSGIVALDALIVPKNSADRS